MAFFTKFAAPFSDTGFRDVIFISDAFIGAFLNRSGIIGYFMLTCFLMTLTRIDGKPLMTFEEAFTKGVPWPVYFMLAAAMTIATSLTKADVGFSATIMDFVTAHIASDNVILFVILLLASSLILTNCINNAVAQQLMAPILATLCIGIGINPLFLAGLLSVAIDHGNLFPSGSPIGALMHSNTEWMTSAQVYLHAGLGSIFILIGLAVCAPICLAIM